VTIVLDAGALVAVDRRDRRVGALLRVAQRERIPVRTSAAVVAQVWRAGARQAPLARTLAGVATVALDLVTAKRLGVLLGVADASDVVDAHVAALVAAGDTVLTSDPDDVRRLLAARRVAATISRV
jgi:hypothetical protein